jgi:hypothetical protein
MNLPQQKIEFGTSEHASLAPSSMGITVNCSYYPHISKQYVDDSNLAAEEGTAAHWVLEQLLSYWVCWGYVLPEEYVKSLIGSKADNGIFVNEEMVDCAKFAFEHCISLVTSDAAYRTILVEGRVHMPQIHLTDCWGTLDFGFYDPYTRTIVIRDYKHGFGLVEVFENYQLICYCLGMIVKHPDCEFVDLGVIQPRPHHKHGACRSWKTHISALYPLVQRLQNKIVEVYSNPYATPGDHCRYCPGAKHLTCDAFINSAYNAIDMSFAPSLTEMTNEQLGNLYETAKRAFNAIKYLRDNVANQIISKIDSGSRVAGWALDQPMGNSYWSKSDIEIEILCEELGIKDPTTKKMKTPIQVLNLLPVNDERREQLEKYLKRRMGNISIIPDDGREADRVFGNK